MMSVIWQVLQMCLQQYERRQYVPSKLCDKSDR